MQLIKAIFESPALLDLNCFGKYTGYQYFHIEGEGITFYEKALLWIKISGG
jgi:hypothetical protein